MILIIDNYDSFTYILADYFKQLGQSVCVKLHDQITFTEIEQIAPSHLVISPGPKRPEDAGISMAAIVQYYQKLPILGVCLGHQCLAAAFGGKIITAPKIIHGKTSLISHQQQGLFQGLPSPFNATRYHSLAVERESLPDCFAVDAWVDDTIMAIRHHAFPLFGVQFHPEAILTEYGLHLLQNFCHYLRYTPNAPTR